ncbi:MAG TPA: SufD family Fe-S cluster assembly protein, partial [Candidatus Angelobacter sp.]|nr:SufD family Fe-S cluster assembly protein [Candidatus Angelobacter sp.]
MNPSDTLAPPRTRDSLRVGALTQTEIAALSKGADEPEFLARRRAEAWAYCEKTPFPARTEELWRRTDISSLKWGAVVAARDPHPVVSSAKDLPAALRAEIGPVEERSALLVQIDSNAVLVDRDEELAALGVLVMPIRDAARAHPVLLERFLGRTVRFDESRFTGLAAALESGGAFVYVPDGVKVPRPIRLLFSRQTPDLGTFPHVVLALGGRAEAAIIEEYVSYGEPGVGVNIGATEVTVGEAASLHLATFQRWGGNVYHFGTERVRIARDARFHWTYTALGGKLTKLDLEMHLDGEGTEAKFSGCYFGNGTQHFDFHTFQNHNVG